MGLTDRNSFVFWLALFVGALSAASAWAEPGWDRAAAARYLDARASLWTSRSRARQELETACISCHTGMPYLLSRSSLEGPSAEPARSLYSDVETRVMHWDSVEVWYDESRGPEKPKQSWGTESVLNALVLALRDERAGGPLTAAARTALDHMWEQQTGEGNWSWLHFGLGPWETDGSDYWGASLAAVAAMSAREAVSPPVEASAKLRDYLRSGLSREMSLHNRLSLLWAASHWDGLVSDGERKRLVDDILEHQQPDGGFRLRELGKWPSRDGSLPSEKSDGYATAFTAFVLQRLDDPACANAISRARAWLRQNQEPDGRWTTLSPNKDRSTEEAFTRLLASDAATAFAVLALTSAPAEKTYK